MRNNVVFTSSKALLSLMLGLYFYWGVITLMNDLLVPLLKADFQLDYFHATLVQFSFFSSYLLCALPAVWLLRRLQYRNSLILGLMVLVLGCAFFVAAGEWRKVNFILLALFTLGCGVVIVQVAANPLLAQLGDSQTAPARLSLGHGVTSFGYTVTPFLLSAYVTMDNMKLIYASIAVVMMLSVFWVCNHDFNRSELCVKNDSSRLFSFAAICHSPVFIASFLGIFFYVGAEIAIGSLIVNFLQLPRVAHMSMKTASAYLSFYWGGAMLGRLIGVRILMSRSPCLVLSFHAVVNVCLIFIAVFYTGNVAMWALLLIGLFNSIMFPVIFSIGLGCFPDTRSKNAVSACLAMATCGGALVPLFQGWLADHLGLQYSFLGLIPCYVYIAFLGLYVFRRV